MSDVWIDERYRVESALGQGGMGAVYAVHDVGTGTTVALKQTSASAPEVVRDRAFASSWSARWRWRGLAT